MPIKKVLLTSLILFFLSSTKSLAANYYMSPSGSGSKDGSSTANAMGSFSTAWSKLKAGDTLYLMDGVYSGPMRPTIKGSAGSPITIKALNDGKAIIDGGKTNYAIQLGTDYDGGATGQYFVLEGLVARNGSTYVILLQGDNNILRRVSAYNADPDVNSTVILVWSDNNLLEDVSAGGSGRYMVEAYTSGTQTAYNNTFRRVFAYWQNWDGRKFCGVAWPNGTNIGIYNSSNNTVENSISYGKVPGGIMAQANEVSATISNVAVLGSISVLTGLDYNGNIWTFGTGQNQPTSRPGPIVNPYGDPCPTNLTQWDWGNQRLGIQLWGQGNVKDMQFKDILSVDSAGVGFSAYDPLGSGSKSGNTIDHATIVNSAKGTVADWEKYDDPKGNLTIQMGGVSNPTNSFIPGIANGEGARLQNMYINRTLTNSSLWPWPMEERIKSEAATYFGFQNFSVTNEVCQKYLSASGSASKGYSMNVNCNLGGPIPTVVYPSPTPVPSPSPVSVPIKIEGENFTSYSGGFEMVASSNASGGQRLGYIDNGTSFNYTVNTPTTSNYNFTISTSTDTTAVSKIMALYVDDESSPRGTYNITNAANCTDCWNTFKESTVSNISLTAGTHNIMLVVSSNYFDYDYLNITKSGTTVTPTPVVSSSPTKVPTPSPSTTPSINPIFDVNNDGKVNLLDVIAILNEIFK